MSSTIGRSSGSDRTDPHERLDGAALVHGGVGVGDAVEVGLVVEDEAGVDAARRARRRAARGCRAATGAGPPRQPTLRKKVGVERHLDRGGRRRCRWWSRGGRWHRGVDRLLRADALERRRRPRRRRSAPARRRSASSPRLATMSVAPNARASFWRRGFRLRAMIRSAPSRDAASTADSPTAPSPTTATTSPAVTPALTAAWWPVDITSDSVSSERRVSSVWPDPGTGTRVLPASGTRTASPWPPSISPLPNSAALHAGDRRPVAAVGARSVADDERGDDEIAAADRRRRRNRCPRRRR